MLPAILGVAGGITRLLAMREARKRAASAGVAGVAGFAGGTVLNRLTDGPEPFEGAPDNPGDVYGATRLRWDYKTESWVPFKSRRRKRAMTASDKADFAFLKSQGLSAEKAAGLVMAGVGRTR